MADYDLPADLEGHPITPGRPDLGAMSDDDAEAAADAEYEDDSSSPDDYECPNCQAVIAIVRGDRATRIGCPQCGNEFVVAGTDGSTDPDEQADDERASEEDELSSLRVFQVTKARRAAIRSRSYAFIAAVGFLVAAGQGAYDAWRRTLSGDFGMEFRLLVLFVAGSIAAGIYFAFRTRQIHREIRQALLPEPLTPPDFSTLSNGSQHVSNLEHL